MSENTTAVARVIPFRQAELLLVEKAGQPFVPMRPVVEGMGLDWKTQHRKLQGGRFNTCMVEMTIQLTGDIQRREFSCLPLRKLAGWLMSIHPAKVRESIRDSVIAYQNECDDALWAYWNDGVALRTDDRSFETVLSTTIGIDGFHVLSALVAGKVRALPRDAQRRATMKLWAQVHAAFNVRRSEDIPASQMDAARCFVGSYVFEGEWIEAAKPGVVVSLNDEEAQAVHLLISHTKQLVSMVNEIYRAGGALRSDLLIGAASHLWELRVFLAQLDRKKSGELEQLHAQRCAPARRASA